MRVIGIAAAIACVLLFTPANAQDAHSQLQLLQQMYKEGLITKDVYEQKQREVLGIINPSPNSTVPPSSATNRPSEAGPKGAGPSRSASERGADLPEVDIGDIPVRSGTDAGWVTRVENATLSVASTPNATAWYGWAISSRDGRPFQKISASIAAVQGKDDENRVVGAGVYFGDHKGWRIALVARPDGYLAGYFRLDDDRIGQLCGSLLQIPKLADGKFHKYELAYLRGSIEVDVDGRNVMSCTPDDELIKASIAERKIAGLLVSGGGDKGSRDLIQATIRNVVVEKE